METFCKKRPVRGHISDEKRKGAITVPRNRMFPISNHLRQKIFKRDDYLCQYCGEDAIALDHVIPYTWCFNNREDNLVAVCTIVML